MIPHLSVSPPMSVSAELRIVAPRFPGRRRDDERAPNSVGNTNPAPTAPSHKCLL